MESDLHKEKNPKFGSFRNGYSRQPSILTNTPVLGGLKILRSANYSTIRCNLKQKKKLHPNAEPPSLTPKLQIKRSVLQRKVNNNEPLVKNSKPSSMKYNPVNYGNCSKGSQSSGIEKFTKDQCGLNPTRAKLELHSTSSSRSECYGASESCKKPIIQYSKYKHTNADCGSTEKGSNCISHKTASLDSVKPMISTSKVVRCHKSIHAQIQPDCCNNQSIHNPGSNDTSTTNPGDLLKRSKKDSTHNSVIKRVFDPPHYSSNAFKPREAVDIKSCGTNKYTRPKKMLRMSGKDFSLIPNTKKLFSFPSSPNEISTYTKNSKKSSSDIINNTSHYKSQDTTITKKDSSNLNDSVSAGTYPPSSENSGQYSRSDVNSVDSSLGYNSGTVNSELSESNISSTFVINPHNSLGLDNIVAEKYGVCSTPFEKTSAKEHLKLTEEQIVKAGKSLSSAECYNHKSTPALSYVDNFISEGHKPLPKLTVAKTEELLFPTECYNNEDPPSFLSELDDFKSAGSKPLPTLSKESINRAKEFLSNEGCHNDQNNSVITLEGCGFKSAGSKQLSVLSKESINKAEEFLARTEFNNNQKTPLSSSELDDFKSAGSKPLPTLSKESIARAEKFLAYTECHNDQKSLTTLQGMCNIKSAGSEPLSILSNEFTIEAEEFFSSKGCYNDQNNSVTPLEGGGFKSAGSKPLSVLSKESIAKAEKFLTHTECHNDQKNPATLPEMCNLKSAESESLSILSNEAGEFLPFKEYHNQNSQSTTLEEDGFKSAGSKPLTVISKESITRAEKFLAHTEFNNNQRSLSIEPKTKDSISAGYKIIPVLSDESTDKVQCFSDKLKEPHQKTSTPHLSHILKNPDTVIKYPPSPQSRDCSVNLMSTPIPGNLNSTTFPRASQFHTGQSVKLPDQIALLKPSAFLEHELVLDNFETCSVSNIDRACSTNLHPSTLNVAKNKPRDDSIKKSSKSPETDLEFSKTVSNLYTQKMELDNNVASPRLSFNTPSNVEFARKCNSPKTPSSNMCSILFPESIENGNFHISPTHFKDNFTTQMLPKVCDNDVRKALEDLGSSIDVQLDLGSLLFDDLQPLHTTQNSSKVTKKLKNTSTPKKAPFITPFKKGFETNTIKPPVVHKKYVTPAASVKFFNVKVTRTRKTLKDLYFESASSQHSMEYADIDLPTNSESSTSYKFLRDIDICGVVERVELGPHEALTELVRRGANSNICTYEWVSNHYRWIVWKLASLYRKYPSIYKDKWCYTKVVEQLCYRYETEVNLCRTSILKKISEGDFPPGNHMILCVSKILTRDNEPLISMDELPEPLLEMTDGWYQLIFIPDEGLRRCVEQGKIYPGCKLSICCASLHFPGVTMPILEARSRVKLLIGYNSTRKARPWKKLGLQRSPRFTVSIKSISGKGVVPLVDVFIIKKYPLHFYVKQEGSPGFFLNYKANYKKMQEVAFAREERFIDTTLKNGNHKDECMEYTPDLDSRSNTSLNITSTPVLKLVIRDYRSSLDTSNQDNTAELHVWNIDEQTEKCLSKGMHVKIYNIETSKIKRKYEGTDIKCLSSRKNTLIVPQKSTSSIVYHADDITNTSISCGGLKLFIDHLRISEGDELDITGVIVAIGEVLKLDVSRNGFEYERSMILSDFSYTLVFIRIFGITKTELSFETNKVLELKNVIYKGYDEGFSLYNLGFTFNSSFTRQKGDMAYTNTFKNNMVSMDLEGDNDVKMSQYLSLPSNFYDCLPTKVIELMNNI